MMQGSDPALEMQEERERRALFLLNHMQGMLSDKLLKIYEYFGSFEEAYSRDADTYLEAGIFKKEQFRENYENLRRDEGRLLKKYEQVKSSGIRMIMLTDSEYPLRLRVIGDRPPLLYVGGKLPDENRPTAGIIGSRKCSEYGKSVAEFFAGELAARGIQIISGLAYGIDASAAAGSLRTASESYGVLGCGVNVCYPRENWPLYHRMKHGEGGVISEFPPDDDALGFHFILRNRLIAGLSDVLIVIEAAERSGTSTTVGFALDQGKEVFALPGRITDPLGFGCNRLLKEGANVLTSPSDILDYFGMGEDAVLKMGEKDLSRLSGDEKKIYSVLGPKSQHVETVAAKSGFPLGEALSLLAGLEAKGYAVSPRGAYYRRNV